MGKPCLSVHHSIYFVSVYFDKILLTGKCNLIRVSSVGQCKPTLYVELKSECYNFPQNRFILQNSDVLYEI